MGRELSLEGLVKSMLEILVPQIFFAFFLFFFFSFPQS